MAGQSSASSSLRVSDGAVATEKEGSSHAEASNRLSLWTNLVQRVNVGDSLTRTAWRMPEALAVVDGDRRFSYAELNCSVNRLANSLAERGYGSSSVLAMAVGNTVEFVMVYYACAKLGVVTVPLNLGWKSPEVAYVLDHSRADGIVIEAALLGSLQEAISSVEGLKEVIVIDGDGTESHLSGKGNHPYWLSFEQLLEAGDEREPLFLVEDRHPMSYLYTSGTTSAPKGVVSSHLAVYMESLSAVVESGLDHTVRNVVMMPLFHTAQLNWFLTPVVIVGGSSFMMRGFDAGQLLELIERERITHIFGLPMMYRALLAHPDLPHRDLSSLQRATYAMAPMPDEDLRKAIEMLGCDFALGFGQTEMNPITTIFRPEDQLRYPGSVGTQIVNVQTAIMDDSGNLLPPGKTGEIVYRGPHAMEGYLRDDKATEEAFAGGWFHSGDVGHIDENGVLWFEDRKKDVIKTGGENVASIEVEKAIYDAEPRIGEVAVIGVPHPHWGEAITAVVVPKPGEQLSEEEVLTSARQRLAGFKVPKKVILRSGLPHTSTGKIQKATLRKELKSLYEGEGTD